MALLSNLAASWSLDNSLADASGNGNTLTNINTVDINATGKINQGADFEFGSSQYLYCEDSTSLSITDDISFSLWFKPESHTSNMVFLAKADRLDRDPFDWRLYWETDNTIRFQYSGVGSIASNTLLTAAFTPSDGTWYHLVGVFDVGAQSGTLYVNNSASAFSLIGGTQTSISDSNVQVIIGSDGGGNFLDGVADIGNIWSKKLTADEVSQLYNGGNAIQHPFINSAVNFFPFFGPQPQV